MSTDMATPHLKLAKDISFLMKKKGLTLAIAESCTGGLVSHLITNIPGASDFFRLAIVSYSVTAKTSLLGVKTNTINRHGTVSEETAVQMALGVRKLGKTDVSLAVTGIAGPGEVEGKKAGTVYIAVSVGRQLSSACHKFAGSRDSVKEKAAVGSLQLLRKVLRAWE